MTEEEACEDKGIDRGWVVGSWIGGPKPGGGILNRERELRREEDVDVRIALEASYAGDGSGRAGGICSIN